MTKGVSGTTKFASAQQSTRTARVGLGLKQLYRLENLLGNERRVPLRSLLDVVAQGNKMANDASRPDKLHALPLSRPAPQYLLEVLQVATPPTRYRH